MGTNGMPSVSTVRVEIRVAPPVARLVLTNPPLNVIDVPMMQQLTQALSEIEARSDISIILFEGNRQAFSAGVDIKAHVPEQVRDMLSGFHAVIRAVVASRKITIAAVHGKCLGGGAELAVVCDMVYTARDATWDFLRSSWAVIRRSRRWRFLRWSVRSEPANLF